MHNDQAHRSLIGALWMIGWAICINGAMIVAKFLSSDISNVMIILMRNLFALLWLMPATLVHGSRLLTSQQWPRQFCNAVLIVSTMGCTYYAYRNLPLAFATSLGFSGPFITTAFAVFFLKDKVKWSHWVWIGVGYFGVLIILYPINIMVNKAVLVLILANVLAALAIINRKILLRTDTSESILFIGNLGGVVICGVISIFFWQALKWNDIKLLTMIGGLGILSQFCYLNALKSENASYVAPFEYSRLLIAIPAGILLFEENYTHKTIAGVICIVTAGLFLLKSARIHKD